MGDHSVVVVAFFVGVVIAVFLSIEEMDSVYHYNTNGHGETLSYNGLRQMGSIIFPGMLLFWSIQPI